MARERKKSDPAPDSESLHLRELMEARFDGLDAKLDGKVDGLRGEFAGLRGEFEGLRSEFQGLGAKFDGVNAKVDALLQLHGPILETVRHMRTELAELRAIIEKKDQIGFVREDGPDYGKPS